MPKRHSKRIRIVAEVVVVAPYRAIITQPCPLSVYNACRYPKISKNARRRGSTLPHHRPVALSLKCPTSCCSTVECTVYCDRGECAPLPGRLPYGDSSSKPSKLAPSSLRRPHNRIHHRRCRRWNASFADLLGQAGLFGEIIEHGTACIEHRHRVLKEVCALGRDGECPAVLAKAELVEFSFFACWCCGPEK
jgi:hypothetical protein